MTGLARIGSALRRPFENPVWVRELKQAARLTRTPVILAVLAIVSSLLIASVGGVMSGQNSPAETGVALYQTFFSLAFFVAMLVGPALGANAIASEREGRTWEALLLTGLEPRVVARGKFLAAYTVLATYVVMLAPVGALPFLFGGVGAIEVLFGFVLLFAFAVVGVGFGLAISAKLASLRAALLVTLLLAFPLGAAIYGFFGFALSHAAHDSWPAVTEGMPVWLPVAYDRVPWGRGFVVFLVVVPLAALIFAAWFLYEVTVANLVDPTDDRSYGVKRWYLAAAPTVATLLVLPAEVARTSNVMEVSLIGLSLLVVFLVYGVFLFAGEPLGPSRRLRVRWAAQRASALRRFLGPGVMRATALVLALGVLSLALLTGLGLRVVHRAANTDRIVEMEQVAAFAVYAAAYYVFFAGAGAFVRARAQTPLGARMWLLATLVATSLGPWIVAAISGVIRETTGPDEDPLLVATPSPFYAFRLVDLLDDAEPHHEAYVVAAICALVYVLAGAGLTALAARRIRWRTASA